MTDVPRVARTREDADVGVRRCVELMTGGHWISGASHQAVAEEFGVSPRTVEDWATSASRIIRVAVEGDLGDVRARMLATLDTIVSKAMTGKEDLKAAVSAIEAQAKILGFAKQQVQFSGALGLVGGTTADQLRLAQSVVRALESQKEGDPHG